MRLASAIHHLLEFRMENHAKFALTRQTTRGIRLANVLPDGGVLFIVLRVEKWDIMPVLVKYRIIEAIHTF